MRIARGNHLTIVWQHTKTVVMLLLAATIIIGLYRILSPVAGAEEPDAAPVAETPPVELQLTDGNPVATSLEYLRRDNAVLTWTPTGSGIIQDTYDIRVSLSNQTDPVTNELLESQRSQDGLPSATFDMKTEPATTYYWQVRSCWAPGLCRDWSPVWTMYLDDITPGAPTAEVTSRLYDRSVSFAGTGEPGTTAVISVEDQTREAVVDTEGNWIVDFEAPFEYGAYTASVKLVDRSGNQSDPTTVEFSVKELFVAAQITVKDLPVALDIVPVDESPVNSAFKQPSVATIDVVNDANGHEAVAATQSTVPLSTEGGIVQSSKNGWQVLGVPWFLWAGIGGMLSATWFVSTGRLARGTIAA